MKRLPIVMLLILCSYAAFAQRPSVELWDKRFGGTGEEGEYAFQQTTDGGYIMGGISYSAISGNKTQNNWDTSLVTPDYWVVKIDSLGNKQWDKRFGGTDIDQFFTLQQTMDGGYILGGMTGSGANGDISQQPFGGWDYWVVKIDAWGNKQWDSRFGGTGDDILSYVYQTKDSGYLLVGESDSPISGDKTQDSYGGSNDGWVVKIDVNGNKQWDKRFGGLSDDNFDAAVQTKDGGYLIGGSTNSDSGYDISEPSWGSYDYWVVKIDSMGNKQWDERYGGTGSDGLGTIISCIDGSYTLGGQSQSDSSGDKTTSDTPLWIVKIDSTGNKLWDNAFGYADIYYCLIQSFDKGFVISGTSSSNIADDKTENNLGNEQTWIVKTDSGGRKQWDKTIMTYNDNTGYAIQTFDSCYVIGGATNAGIGGYKTQPNWDTTEATWDYWISKYCFDGLGEGIKELTPQLQLNVYPNPFTNELDITLAQQNLKQADFSICNLLGQTVYTQQETNLSPTYTKMLDLSNLPNGVYWVEVVVDGEVSVREVVKQ